jgi:hypothetical protein
MVFYQDSRELASEKCWKRQESLPCIQPQVSRLASTARRCRTGERKGTIYTIEAQANLISTTDCYAVVHCSRLSSQLPYQAWVDHSPKSLCPFALAASEGPLLRGGCAEVSNASSQGFSFGESPNAHQGKERAL